jgi:uncharacterized protein (DUF2252 family)
MAERAAMGKAAREAVPRSSHAVWTPGPDRKDPVELFEQQAATRVPELVPIRHGRMLVSPFTFYRGAAYVMAADLATTARTTLHAQLCGDAHLSNFGAFAAPDRRLVFSVNDFDETLPGPFEWDVKRLVASFAVAGRDRGFDLAARESVNLTLGRAYREAMSQFAGMRTLDLWYARIDVDELRKQWAARVNRADLKRFDRNVAKARAKDSVRAVGKLTRVVDGQPRIVSDPPLIVPIDQLFPPDRRDQFEEWIRTTLRAYRRTLAGDRRRLLERFRFVDAARKVVGVGSVGTRAFIALLVGNDENDPLMIQIKEAEASVLEPFLGRSGFANHGQRVVEGQRLMQAASDIMLGWIRIAGADDVERDFYVRQLWDSKLSPEIDIMDSQLLRIYAETCGWTLAKAHARSGDAVAIASYLGGSDVFDRAMATFAESYADQNDRDYATFRAAIDAGRLAASPGL